MGLFMFNLQTWIDAGGTKENFQSGAKDPALSSAMAVKELYRKLNIAFGSAAYKEGLANGFSEDQIKRAITDFGPNPSDVRNYSSQIWDCAQSMKRGDETGAFRAIGKII